MADKFTNWSTQICADWLNKVDWAVFDALDTPTTPEEARLNINAVEEAPLNENAYVRSNEAWIDVNAWPLFGTLIYYLGAQPTFPSAMLDGSALRPGAMFYHTVNRLPYVYTYQGWSTFESPTPAYQISLEYIAVSNNPTINLTTLDTQGNSHVLQNGERVDGYINGSRQLPSEITVDIGSNTVSITGVITGDELIFDVLTPASKIAYGKILLWPTKEIVPDGIVSTFVLQTVDDADLDLPSDQALMLYIDGKRQIPTTDYSVSSGLLTTTLVPRADSVIWAYWMEN